jgi:hypothetical protein
MKDEVMMAKKKKKHKSELVMIIGPKELGIIISIDISEPGYHSVWINVDGVCRLQVTSITDIRLNMPDELISRFRSQQQ